MTRLRDQIPAELRALDQWVTWKREVREGKATKVPYTTDGTRRASCDDPSTWGAFAEAAKSLTEGRVSGTGFQVSAGQSYVGADLDHCRNSTTGEIEPWAQRVIDLLDSYSEISPSQEGVRIFLKAAKPGPRCRKGNIEIYDRSRFLTVTGQHLPGTPATIEERQEELERLYWELFPERPHTNATAPRSTSGLTAWEVIGLASKAKNSSKFEALMRGDTSAFGGDDSAADLALCSLVAFYSQDPSVVDAVIRQSGLYREKWDRADYRDRTIGAALERVTESYTPAQTPTNGTPDRHAAKPPVSGLLVEFSGSELAAMTEDDLQMLWLPMLGLDGWFVEKWSHLLSGYPRAGKTELIVRLIRGWLHAGQRVLVLSEEPRTMWALRLRGLGGDWSGLQVVCALGVDPELLMERAVAGSEEIVIVDTLRNLLQLQDERDNSEVARVVNPWAAAMRQADKTLVMAHHQRKGGGDHGEAISGAHALLGAFDIAIELKFDTVDHPDRRVLASHPRLIDRQEVVYEKRGLEFVVLGEPGEVNLNELSRLALEVLSTTPQTTQEVHQALDEPRPGLTAVKGALRQLALSGSVRRDPDISIKTVRGKTVRWTLSPLALAQPGEPGGNLAAEPRQVGTPEKQPGGPPPKDPPRQVRLEQPKPQPGGNLAAGGTPDGAPARQVALTAGSLVERQRTGEPHGREQGGDARAAQVAPIPASVGPAAHVDATTPEAAL